MCIRDRSHSVHQALHRGALLLSHNLCSLAFCKPCEQGYLVTAFYSHHCTFDFKQIMYKPDFSRYTTENFASCTKTTDGQEYNSAVKRTYRPVCPFYVYFLN